MKEVSINQYKGSNIEKGFSNAQDLIKGIGKPLDVICGNFEKGIITADELSKAIDTLDIIEKGKKAQIGEIREWGNGKKVRKTVNGWEVFDPKKEGGKSEPKKEEKGTMALVNSLANFNENLNGKDKEQVSKFLLKVDELLSKMSRKELISKLTKVYEDNGVGEHSNKYAEGTLKDYDGFKSKKEVGETVKKFGKTIPKSSADLIDKILKIESDNQNEDGSVKNKNIDKILGKIIPEGFDSEHGLYGLVSDGRVSEDKMKEIISEASKGTKESGETVKKFGKTIPKSSADLIDKILKIENDNLDEDGAVKNENIDKILGKIIPDGFDSEHSLYGLVGDGKLSEDKMKEIISEVSK